MPGALHRQHQQIRSLIAQFEAFLVPDTLPADREAMVAIRWQLASTIYEHLSLEDRRIYLPLKCDARPEVVAATQASRERLIALYDRTQRHVETWPTSVALGRWREYCGITRALLRDFYDRMDEEEATVYIWARNNPDIAAGEMGPHERNWIAPAWEARERIRNIV